MTSAARALSAVGATHLSISLSALCLPSRRLRGERNAPSYPQSIVWIFIRLYINLDFRASTTGLCFWILKFGFFRDC